MKTLNGLTL